MRKIILSAMLFLVATVASAATVVDVNFVVPQSIVDAKGREALFSGIKADLAGVDSYYLSQYTGIVKDGKPEDIKFNLRQIVVVSDKSSDAECAAGMVFASSVLYWDGQLVRRDGKYPEELAVELDETCISPEDYETIRVAGSSSGADVWVNLQDKLTSDLGGMAGQPSDIALVVQDHAATGHYVNAGDLAHEFFHLLGGVDLYNTPEAAKCEQGGEWSGRLMCGGVEPSPRLFGANTWIDENLFLQRFYNNPSTTEADWTVGSTFYGSVYKASGAALMTAPANAERVAELAVSGTTLSKDVPNVTLSVKIKKPVLASNPDDKTPVAVEVYSQGVTAKAGAEYIDNLTQTVTFDPLNPDYQVNADNEWVKEVVLTAKDLNYNSSKSMLVGLRNGNATAVNATPISISIVGSAPDLNPDEDTIAAENGDGGGGSSAPLVVLGLAAMAFMRRKTK